MWTKIVCKHYYMLCRNKVQCGSSWSCKLICRSLTSTKLSTPAGSLEDNTENTSKKILKVAILGRPNVGKSTLINRILELNVCDVSSKTHTTLFPVRAAFTSGNTQIIFVDTPGLVTAKEFSKFNLAPSCRSWKHKVFEEIDMVAVIQEPPWKGRTLRFKRNLVTALQELNLPSVSKPAILVINKIDLVEDNGSLFRLKNDSQSIQNMKFSKVFYVSALKGMGHDDLVHYLLKEAKEGDWLLDGCISDTPLHLLVTNLLRAKFLNLLPHEVPYECKYEVEYLEENSFGEMVCVALIKCRRPSQVLMIIKKRRKSLKTLCQEIESDLYNILKKVFRLRVVVVTNTTKK